jgi:hypothetical protein
MPAPKTLSKYYSTKDMETICMMLKDAILPARRVGTFDHRSKGVQRSLPNDIIYQPVPTTFYVDRELKLRQFFSDWVNTMTTNGHMSFNYLDEYAVPIQITQLDETGKAVHTIELVDAYPTGLSEVQLSADSDNQLMLQNIIFTYHNWHEVNSTTLEDLSIGGIFNELTGLGGLISSSADIVSSTSNNIESLVNRIR